MLIINNKEIDDFLFAHKDNGCTGIKSGLKDNDGLFLNTAWQDDVTMEKIKVVYDSDHYLTIKSAECLWEILDDISTAGDAFKPDLNDPFVKYVLDKCEQKNKHFDSDGYNLFFKGQN